MRIVRIVGSLLLAALVPAVFGCGDGGPPTGPGGGDGGGEDPPRLSVSIQGGDGQFGVVGTRLEDPLQVIVTEAATGDPAEGVAVTWEVTEGAGAELSATETTTNSLGIARVRLTLGPDPGRYRVRAEVENAVGSPPVFRARAVRQPEIDSILPRPATAGDTVTIFGDNFAPDADELAVVFGDAAGVIIDATVDRLRVEVPRCTVPGPVQVTVRLGPVASDPVALDVRSDPAAAVDLEPGEVLTLYASAQLDCIQFSGQAGARYLIVAQNASDRAGTSLAYRLRARVGEQPSADRRPAPRAAHAGALRSGGRAVPLSALNRFGVRWKARFRRRMRRRVRRALRAGPPPRPDQSVARAAVPQVGDTTRFTVYSPPGYDTVTAVVRAVSEHGIFYEDVEAPDPGLTAADYDSIASLFDDPIYPTDTNVFGDPSDIDDNGHVIALFTPAVNKLTPPGSNGFVAGFFYPCDLLPDSDGCRAVSNSAEIFYTLVPDPQAEFGNEFTREDIFETVVPSVLAHEFQHMISFNQRVLLRGASPEADWLSEGLAHMAEDTVGEVLLARGKNEAAFNFRVQNFVRALLYLGPRGANEEPGDVTLIGTTASGATLEERGASWLFLKYLEEHPGRYGRALLTDVTQTRLTSVTNVSTHVGEPWRVLFNRWAVALFADGAPALEGDEVDPLFLYPDFELRRTVRSEDRAFPLEPPRHGFEDFTVRDTLPSSSADYLIIEAGTADPPTLTLEFTRPDGTPFAVSDRAQIAILRLD